MIPLVEDRWALEMAGKGALIFKSDPNLDPDRGTMRLRLTYDGPIFSYSKSDRGMDEKRAKHKQELRKRFHPQLKRWWEVNPFLRTTDALVPTPKGATWKDHLANCYARNGYNFVPLVDSQIFLVCSLHILFLRVGGPGQVIDNGDLDNRIKTVIDGLTMPINAAQLGPYATPDDDEKPFFVLLQDDKLVSHLAVETDTLLEPTTDRLTCKPLMDANQARLVVTATIRPSDVHLENLSFI